MTNYERRTTNYERLCAGLFCVLSLLLISGFATFAQSRDQNYPTPVKTNEIGGRIPARDLGDARLTTFYYTFDGTQGDVFINVVTTNFNGDIDVFTAENLRPLTKITAYADSSNNETGRVVYLRQPVKLILRVEGRTPNDDAATFQIKFAGSFAPSTAVADAAAEPEVKFANDSDVRVNSVGTIIEVKPKPTPTPKEIIAKVEKPSKEKKPEATEKETVEEKPEAKESETKAETVAKEPKPKKPKPPKVPKKPDAVVKEKDSEQADAEKKETAVKAATGEEVKEKAETEKSAKETAKTPKEKKKSSAPQPVPASALENINLVILFRDGSKIERPMSEILKFGVDKGIVTVISKDGAIGRYSILDVEKITVQ